MTTTITDLCSLGYSVGEAFRGGESDAPIVYAVSGLGIQTYVREDDQQMIDSLADPVKHAARVAASETLPPDPLPPGPDLVETLKQEMLTALGQLPATANLTDVVAALKTALGG
jgi:hypothetical protein